MFTRALLPTAFVAAFLSFAHFGDAARPGPAPLAVGEPAEPGTFPAKWIYGGFCGIEPDIQVHAYNSNLVILRQSKCETVEAPFIYLIFGTEKVLMLDTGATPDSNLKVVVDRVVERWKIANGVQDLELIAAHTHSHGDHIAGDAQFIGQPGVTYVPTNKPAVEAFFGFTNWPNEVIEYDLGNRILDIFPTPGHEKSSITVYDRATQILFTGDIIYPGHLFIFAPEEWVQFVSSINRITGFAQQNPVTWVLGCHIEMTDTPFVPYDYGTFVQPDEHTLELDPAILLDLQAAVNAMGFDSNDAECQQLADLEIRPVYKCGLVGN